MRTRGIGSLQRAARWNDYFSSLHSVSRSEFFYLSMVLVLALLLRLPPINRGLGEDELDTVFYVLKTGSIWQIMSSSLSFNNHIGYSLMAYFSQALFGHSEWAFRLPALLLGLASLYLFWIFSQYLLGPRLAMVGTFIFAFSPAHIIWSISGRGYSGLILFTLLSSYFYLRLLHHPTRRDAFFFIVVSVLGIYVHLYSAFVTIVQTLFLLCLTITQQVGRQSNQHITGASFRILCVSFIAIVALSLLCYIPALRQLFHDIGVRGRSDFNPTFPWTVIEFLSGSEWSPLVVVVFIISVCGLLSLLRSHPQEVRYFTWLFVGPILIMWLVRPFDLYPRFFSYCLPYYLVFFVAGLRTLWDSAASNYLRLTSYSSRILAVVITATVLYHWSMNWHNWIADEGYRDASRAIAMNAPGSATFCAIGGDAEVFQYYFDRQIVVPRSMTEFLELSRTHPEVRCVYYQASWESVEHTEIAQFLLKHSSWSRVKKMTLFIYRR